jgi:hypothetical protein
MATGVLPDAKIVVTLKKAMDQTATQAAWARPICCPGT